MAKRKYSRSIVCFTCLYLLISLLLPMHAKSETITEFSAGISPMSFPTGITTGPDGNLWFAEREGNRIGRITPTGVVTEFSEGITPYSHPDGITTGPDGNLWFTENYGKRIGRITPTGVVTEFSAGITPNSWPDGIATAHGITTGPDGNLWFAEQSGNRIGRITPDGVVTEFSAGMTPESWPDGITTGPDGNLWFTEMLGNRIGRITPDGVVTEFSAGMTLSSRPTGITTGPDGNLWFTENSGGRIGRLANITAVCIATINGNLSLHIPYLSYGDPISGTLTFWADFIYKVNPTDADLIMFQLTTCKTTSNPSPPCTASTLSDDLKIHIPDVLLPDGTTHLWVNLEYRAALSTDGNACFVVTSYGAVPD